MSAREVSFDEVRSLTSSKSAVIVDVRNRDELADTGKLPDSHCIPLPEVAEAFALDGETFRAKYGLEKPEKDAKERIVISCRSGRRVGMAIDQLHSMGYKNFLAYKGSYLDWVANNGPLEKYEEDSTSS